MLSASVSLVCCDTSDTSRIDYESDDFFAHLPGQLLSSYSAWLCGLVEVHVQFSSSRRLCLAVQALKQVSSRQFRNCPLHRATGTKGLKMYSAVEEIPLQEIPLQGESI